jgi:hypothetical protein
LQPFGTQKGTYEALGARKTPFLNPFGAQKVLTYEALGARKHFVKTGTFAKRRLTLKSALSPKSRSHANGIPLQWDFQRLWNPNHIGQTHTRDSVDAE